MIPSRTLLAASYLQRLSEVAGVGNANGSKFETGVQG